LTVFKALVACALTIMPESELRYFVDTLEWVSNPDAERDAQVFSVEATCRLYSASFLRDSSWTSLARRKENHAPVPYMIFFLAQGGTLLQVSLPLCIRDQDLDGRSVSLLPRSFDAGDGPSFEQAHSWELGLGSGLRSGRGDRKWGR
jgi:hypothetical protein